MAVRSLRRFLTWVLVVHCSGVAAGDPLDLVGERMLHLELRKFYTSDPINQSSLRGCPWVLALVKFKSPSFKALQPLLESVHRPLSEGGPVVLAYSKEDPKEIQRALSRLPQKPTFLVASDQKFYTHRKLGVSEFPYLYMIGADNRVVWQGPADPEIHRRLMKFRRHAISGQKQTPETPKEDSSPNALPADYREQVEASLEGDSSPDQIRLLRLAYRGSEPPKQALLVRLWARLESDLRTEQELVSSRLEKKRYTPARRRLTDLQTRFQGFPPATEALDVHWQKLAREQGGVWYERAQAYQRKGELEKARAELVRILKHYENFEIGKRARQLLDSLEPGRSPRCD